MSDFTDSAQSKQIDQHEHNTDAQAKRIIVRALDPDSGDFVNINAKDNGDGTFSLKTDATFSGSVNAVTEYDDAQATPATPQAPGITFDDAGTIKFVSDVDPLPVDATVNATVDLGDQNIGNATAATQRVVLASDQPVIPVSDNGSSITVDASSLPLPTGAATAANQQTDALTDTELRATPVVVDLGANNDVTVASLPLPTGASTSANQTTIIGHLDGVETLLTTIESNQLPDGHNVTIDNPGDIGGGVQYTEGDTDATFTGTMSLVEGAANAAVTLKQPTTPSDTQPVSASSLPLPTGASTSANQTTIIGHVDGIEALLTTIDSDTSTLAATDFATEAKQDDIITAIGAIPGGGGTQYADGDADATPTGTVAMGTDGTNVFALATDASGNLQTEVINTVTVDGSGVTQPVSAASLPLPTGAATAANQQTDALTDTELRATPVVVDLGANNDVTVTSSALPTGASTAANQTTLIGHVDGIEGLLTTIDADTGNLPTIETNTDFGTVTGGGTETGALRVTVANDSTGVLSVDDNGGSLTVDGTVSITANSAVNVAQMNGVATTMGNGTSGTGVQRVTIASDSTGVIIARGAAATDAAVSGNPVYVGSRASAAEPTSMSADNDAVPFWLDRKGRQVVTMQAATSAVTQVAGSASSVTLKALNTSRKGLTITNDSTADLYVKLGATASTTSYTIKLKQDDYYEVPYGYTGVVDGIWSSATGNAYLTEIS